MELGLTKREEREFNNAVTLYHRAGRERKPEPAWRAAQIFEKLGNVKWCEMAKELYYEIRGQRAERTGPA